MIELVRYAGLALICLCAVLISQRYSAYSRRRIDEGRGFHQLLLHLRGRIRTSLEPIPRAVRGFTNEALEALGFLAALREGENIYDAYLGVEERTALASDTRELLLETFRELGKSSREETLTLIEVRSSELEELVRRDTEEGERSVRLTRTLLYAAALGAVILFI